MFLYSLLAQTPRISEKFRYRTVPLDEIYLVVISLLLIIIAFVVFTIIRNRQDKKVAEGGQWAFHSALGRYGFSVIQKQLIEDLIRVNKDLDFLNLFHDERLYDEAVARFIEAGKRSGHDEELLHHERVQFEKIKRKVQFLRKTPFSSHDVVVGSAIKVRVQNKGYLSGKVLHNDKSGMLVSLPHWGDAVKVIKKGQPAVVYYWGEVQDYEIHAKIKKVSSSKNPYLLISHGKNVFKGRHPRGIGIETEFAVFFQHVFHQTPGEKVKSPVFRGKIVSLSIIGCEIECNRRISPGAVFVFEFKRDTGKSNHFTGTVMDFSSGASGRRLFVKFLDMDSGCHEYVHRYVCRNIK